MNRPTPVEIRCSFGLGNVSRTGVVLEDMVMEDVEHGDEEASAERRRVTSVVRYEQKRDFSDLRSVDRESTSS